MRQAAFLLLLARLVVCGGMEWPVARLTPPEALHVVRVSDAGLLPGCANKFAVGANITVACHRRMRLLTALTSFAGAQLRQASSQGLWVIENEDQAQWLEWLQGVRPHLVVHWHVNTTVWRVMAAMNDAGLRQPLTHVLYTYDPPGSPESLNAARMSASRLNVRALYLPAPFCAMGQKSTLCT